MVLPPALVEPFVQAKQLVDRGAPTLTQAAVADFITEGHFERHLRHLRKAYGERRDLLVCLLHTYLDDRIQFTDIPAGLHVMLFLRDDVSETAVIQAAATVGVRVYGGRPYHVGVEAPPSILLGFSGLSPAEIEEGVLRLADVIP